MYMTRRSGFDRDDARLHYEQLQKHKPAIVAPGDRVVMSDHPTAQIYTVSEVYGVANNTRIMAQLMYVSEYGKVCSAGSVDVSTMLTPSVEQLNAKGN